MNKKLALLLMIVVSMGLFPQCKSSNNSWSLDGELKTWHTLTLSLKGPWASEHSYPNPFLQYRLQVTFEKDDQRYIVPGYFAADGKSAETSAQEGDTWQVRFTPPESGEWSFRVSFRQGPAIAVNEDPEAGQAMDLDGLGGTFTITDSDKSGRDFRAHGHLEYRGERYLRFAGSGEYFIKGGADSPENLLAYGEFDQTRYGGDHQQRSGEDSPNAGLHRYEPHIADWKEGDPSWQNGKGKGIIGAMNYLASKGMNSVYFLTMNVLGDGEDVWPWTGRNERYRFDCSKLEQWEILFAHMEELGIMMHVVLQETENECLLDAGRLDVQRKLYLRELIARFGHHLAITWNIGEENGPANWTPVGQTIQMRKDMMSYIHRTSPYRDFVVTHTMAADPNHSILIEPFLGFEDMEGPSLQLSPPALVHEMTQKWIRKSIKAGKTWVVCSDELGPHWMGVMPDAVDPNHDTIRSQALWGNLMAGGAGVEWYFGYKYAHADLNCEDWRSRDKMWDQTRYALEFFQEHLPFHQMENRNALVDRGWCLALPGEAYAIYLPDGQACRIDLREDPGTYSLFWFNPRNGGELREDSERRISGGQMVSTGPSPSESGPDWVCLLKAI